MVVYVSWYLEGIDRGKESLISVQWRTCEDYASYIRVFRLVRRKGRKMQYVSTIRTQLVRLGKLYTGHAYMNWGPRRQELIGLQYVYFDL
jgi:hypothetical protein